MYIQTIIATSVAILCIIMTLGFNENVYSDKDLGHLLGESEDCQYMPNATMVVGVFSLRDETARNFLYGGFSTRCSSVIGLVLISTVFMLVMIVDNLDLDMSAGKYKEGSWFHEGNTQAFVCGVLFRLMFCGALHSMIIAGCCAVIALSQQGYAPSNTEWLARSDCVDDVLRRTDSLKWSIFFSLTSVFAIGFTGYAVGYDKKASGKVGYNQL